MPGNYSAGGNDLAASNAVAALPPPCSWLGSSTLSSSNCWVMARKGLDSATVSSTDRLAVQAPCGERGRTPASETPGIPI